MVYYLNIETKLTLDEILNYDLKDNQIKRKEKRNKIKDLLDNYFRSK